MIKNNKNRKIQLKNPLKIINQCLCKVVKNAIIYNKGTMKLLGEIKE